MSEKSSLSHLAYQFFKEELEKERSAIFKSLKITARDGKHDLPSYAGGLIAINHLDELEARLLRQIKQGNNVEGNR